MGQQPRHKGGSCPLCSGPGPVLSTGTRQLPSEEGAVPSLTLEEAETGGDELQVSNGVICFLSLWLSCLPEAEAACAIYKVPP